MARNTVRIALERRILVRYLLVATLALLGAHIVTQAASFVTGRRSMMGLVELFNLDRENNIPTTFGVLLLVIAGGLTLVIAVHERSQSAATTKSWFALGVLFLLLALDENASIHEWMEGPVRMLPGISTQGFFFYSWVVLGLAMTVLIGSVFWPFVRKLPRPTAIGLLCAFVLYFGGAVGIEVFEGRYEESYGMDNPGYSLFVLVEESFEMFGVLVAISTLGRYLEGRCDQLSVALGPPESN